MRSAASRSSPSAPSARPKAVPMRASQWRSSSSNVSRSAHDEILMSSAKPLRICAVGSVRRKPKSRKVWTGAW
ncbi:hypothetical protein CDD83_3300 [Cordyceps sp. RAO-2017]|nr:hypothetical protein CDD83_3300 [Cordyceps sp. RAO-2017]